MHMAADIALEACFSDTEISSQDMISLEKTCWHFCSHNILHLKKSLTLRYKKGPVDEQKLSMLHALSTWINYL